MKGKHHEKARPKLSVSLIALGALAGGLFAASPASAALSGCNLGALNELGVPGVQVFAAIDTPAAGATPEFCDVFGAVTTTGQGAPDGLAQFEMQLPANWNHKFYFKGIGGFAGIAVVAFGADNPVDAAQALPKGYATVITDTGHTGHGLNAQDFTGIVTDARWALNPDGSPNEAALTDYYFRATHDVTVAGKQLVEGFYGQGKIREAYFDGCSNGGRMALMEASRFPDDFDGIVAGDPFMSIRSIAGGPNFHKQQFSPDAFISFAQLAMIDQAVLASCDALDGVKDGLIQNPAACNFAPKSLLCKMGQTTNCLTAEQVTTLTAYFTGGRDDDGNVVYPGFTVSDLSGNDGEAAWTNGFFLPGQALPGGGTFPLAGSEPWGNIGFTPAPLGWQFVDHAIKFFVERDPNFNMFNFGGSTIAPLSDATLSLFDRRTEAGDADDPAKFDPFIDKGRKLLVYHGFSDPALTAIRSIQWYEGLANRQGGIEELQENVRMFLVPGMHHCGGGPGPNSFDTLTALENWVEHGEAPEGIIATKFVNDTPSQGVARTMPLCKFPEQARFIGNPEKASASEIDNAENWTCSPHDRSLLRVGTNGVMAGLGLPQAAEGNDDRRDGDHDRDDRKSD